ncbi:SAM-dependent methyltransferase [Streptomyces harbinensis]
MSDALHEAFFALHHGLPRQGPGSDATTRRLLALAGPLPERPRTLNVGCGPGRAALLLAAEAGARVTAVDLHRPFLDELRERAAARGLSDRIRIERHSMTALPYPDGAFDLIWAEGSAYLMGFDAALRSWRRLLAPGGVLVVTECEWATDSPAPRAAAFWAQAGALRSGERNTAAAEAAGYRVLGVHELPDSDWFEEYYDPLARHADAADPARPGMAQAIAGAREEIAVRRAHGADYRYRGYVLTPADTEEKSMWTTPSRTPWKRRCGGPVGDPRGTAGSVPHAAGGGPGGGAARGRVRVAAGALGGGADAGRHDRRLCADHPGLGGR